MTRTGGFTLIELVVTIAVAAVLIALTVPSFQSMVKRNSAANQANSFLGLLTLARSEAVKRNRDVVLCLNASASTPACATSGSWDQGILMYADSNGNSAYDAGEEIRVEVPFTTAGTISNVASPITYRPSGQSLAGGTFQVRSPQGSTDQCGRDIQLSLSGQARVVAVGRYVNGALVSGDQSCGTANYE